jgi:hypothetical protein
VTVDIDCCPTPIYKDGESMEELINKLKQYTKQIIESDIDIARRYIIEKSLNEAIFTLEYVDRLCAEYNIKLGD